MKKRLASWVAVGILLVTVILLGACQGQKSVSSTHSSATAAAATAPVARPASSQASTRQPPLIPHSIELRYECLLCHGEPEETEVPYGPNHTGRTQDICRNCHQPAATTKP